MSLHKIAILGSTGSVGTTALSVVSKYPDRFQVVALSAGDNIVELAKQVKRFRPELVCTRTEDGMKKLKEYTSPMQGVDFTFGEEGAATVASLPNVETVLCAIVGAAGLRPTLAAVRAGKKVALANKESLVVAGALFKRIMKEQGVTTLLPVDSEHSAIFQVLHGEKPNNVKRLILTASGGPFFLKRELDLSKTTREDALKHPNWKMGEKITIDSATLMNKGLELIEAHWLFGFPTRNIDIVIHPQSVIHSMVEYIDGSVIAQLGVPDMAGPISYALGYPDRLGGVMESVNFAKIRELTFFDPDHKRFPSIETARKAIELGETYPAVLNGANEATVAAFLRGQIQFTDIFRINGAVLMSHQQTCTPSELEDYIEADQWGRKEATRLIGT